MTTAALTKTMIMMKKISRRTRKSNKETVSAEDLNQMKTTRLKTLKESKA